MSSFVNKAFGPCSKERPSNLDAQTISRHIIRPISLFITQEDSREILMPAEPHTVNAPTGQARIEKKLLRPNQFILGKAMCFTVGKPAKILNSKGFKPACSALRLESIANTVDRYQKGEYHPSKLASTSGVSEQSLKSLNPTAHDSQQVLSAVGFAASPDFSSIADLHPRIVSTSTLGPEKGAE